MASHGPQSEQEIKFAAIRREPDYNAKRLLIEKLSNTELRAFNIEQQQRYRTNAATFTPAANFSSRRQQNIAALANSESPPSSSAKDQCSNKPSLN